MPVYTDDVLFEETGVRIAFTGRDGGVSCGAFESLNLGSHVGDELGDVLRNRSLLLDALGAKDARLLVPNQVHGDCIVEVSSYDEASSEAIADRLRNAADGICVKSENVAALLCFADCVPVILVAPSGAFSVVHAGWRGVVSRIAPKALTLMGEGGVDPAEVNIYLGPHIKGECFEVSAELHDRFKDQFGDSCIVDESHISLAAAIKTSLVEAGADGRRIAEHPYCTKCNPDAFFSYRASGGECGRHAAVAVRLEGDYR